MAPGRDTKTAAHDRADTYYAATAGEARSYPPLLGTETADVVVIGGGFTGLASAIELAERGLKVALVEAKTIGWGASGRNGGQVTGSLSGDGAMRRQMRGRLGDAVEDFIWRLRWRGHEIIEQRVRKYAIDCDLKHGHLHAAMKPAHLHELRSALEEAQARGMGSQVELLDRDAVREHLASDRYIAALKNQRNMHLHPLKLAQGEARAAEGLGVRIFESSPVIEIVHGPRPAVVTAGGRIEAKQVLLAGDVFHRLERKRLSGLIFPAMGGIVATEPLGAQAKAINRDDLAVYDCRFVLDYHRMTADGRLLFGGGANYSGRESRDVAAELRPAIEATYPSLKGVRIDFQWTCAMGVVINRVPQLGKLSANVWYCQGYSGHGVATTHVMGEIMANAITGDLGRFDVFAACKPIRVPFGDQLGNPLLAVGMWYFGLLERLK
ncbi:MAG: FAD-binding oxidoreductase [Caulobacteraceae bacterium]|nr:FAD-binding oxidoreductase [Caulobacteraceae bacterium]